MPLPNDVLRFRDNLFPIPRAAEALAATAVPAGLLIRKNQQSLSIAEQETFRGTITKAIQSGIYRRMVQFHAEMQHRMHTMQQMGPAGTQRFLPWHRDYLLKLEIELRALEPNFAIPYWDWSTDQAVPAWLQDFLPAGVLDANGDPIPITRQPGQARQFPSLPTSADVTAALAENHYTSFTLRLEGASPFGMHNLVHEWVGGTMSQIPYAPADPLFWLHHAQVDRIWAAWEPTHPGEQPILSGSAAVLDPWAETASEMAGITQLGYQYA